MGVGVAHALGVELRLHLSQLGGVLPAEDSSEVSEERHDHGLVFRPERDRLRLTVHVEELDAGEVAVVVSEDVKEFTKVPSPSCRAAPKPATASVPCWPFSALMSCMRTRS